MTKTVIGSTYEEESLVVAKQQPETASGYSDYIIADENSQDSLFDDDIPLCQLVNKQPSFQLDQQTNENNQQSLLMAGSSDDSESIVEDDDDRTYTNCFDAAISRQRPCIIYR